MEPERPSSAAAGRPAAPLRVLRQLAERIRRTPRSHLVVAIVGMCAYLTAMALAGDSRPEQFILWALGLFFLVWSDTTRKAFSGLVAFLLFGMIYDLLHFTQPLVRYLNIHVAGPYFLDRTLFGISTPEGILSLNEFFSRHHWPIVDLLTGTAYIVYLYWALGFGFYLALFRRDEKGLELLRHFAWTFLAMNLLGIATYYLFPVAPPWYVADYGLGPVHLEARGSAAGALRWDQITGIPYFAGYYARSADVFGAVPSLHVAYPLLVFLFGLELRKRWLNVASMALVLVVAFAAIYLNHHYVLDVVIGVLYAVVPWGVDRLIRRRSRARERAA
jgi:membrane-associated phospholipid phosphatase